MAKLMLKGWPSIILCSVESGFMLSFCNANSVSFWRCNFVVSGCFFVVLNILVQNLQFWGSVPLNAVFFGFLLFLLSICFGHRPFAGEFKKGRFLHTFAAGVWAGFALGVCEIVC